MYGKGNIRSFQTPILAQGRNMLTYFLVYHFLNEAKLKDKFIKIGKIG